MTLLKRFLKVIQTAGFFIAFTEQSAQMGDQKLKLLKCQTYMSNLQALPHEHFFDCTLFWGLQSSITSYCLRNLMF